MLFVVRGKLFVVRGKLFVVRGKMFVERGKMFVERGKMFVVGGLWCNPHLGVHNCYQGIGATTGAQLVAGAIHLDLHCVQGVDGGESQE